MKLQVASRLAIFALLELAARRDQQVSVAEIGEKYGVSTHHLAKVMHALGRAGLVHSVRGAGGGCQFTGNARRVTLLHVIELFEKRDSEDSGKDAPGYGTNEGRALREVLGEIDGIAQATLGSITIATMLKLVDRHRGGGRRPAASVAAAER
ncbi:MAG TPA: Rrf2 family transcriptional regulator [Xanthobacteraceae bacterium]|nr:Rrf2 family transcriptional regulator [Xanthobacteraceae bacterium]